MHKQQQAGTGSGSDSQEKRAQHRCLQNRQGDQRGVIDAAALQPLQHGKSEQIQPDGGNPTPVEMVAQQAGLVQNTAGRRCQKIGKRHQYQRDVGALPDQPQTCLQKQQYQAQSRTGGHEAMPKPVELGRAAL